MRHVCRGTARCTRPERFIRSGSSIGWPAAFLLREEGSGTRAVVERALRRKGLKIKPLLSLASPEAIKNAVAAGMGLAIVSRLIVALEVQAGSLGIIPLKDLTIHRPLHRQRIRGRSRSPALIKFMEVLAAESPSPGQTRRG